MEEMWIKVAGNILQKNRNDACELGSAADVSTFGEGEEMSGYEAMGP